MTYLEIATDSHICCFMASHETRIIAFGQKVPSLWADHICLKVNSQLPVIAYRTQGCN
jgi:hypothetical protein